MNEIRGKKLITIFFNDGSVEEFEDKDNEEYVWGVGPSGELMILRSLKHPQFNNTYIEKDHKYRCYANGMWINVECDTIELPKIVKPRPVEGIVTNIKDKQDEREASEKVT